MRPATAANPVGYSHDDMAIAANGRRPRARARASAMVGTSGFRATCASCGRPVAADQVMCANCANK